MKELKKKIYDEVVDRLEKEYSLDYEIRKKKKLAEFRGKNSIVKLAIDIALKSSKPSLNNDFSKDLDVKELKRRRKELLDHPERGIKLKDL